MEPSDASRFALAKQIVGWGPAPPELKLDNIQLMLGTPTELLYRVYLFCDEPPAITSYTGEPGDIDDLLERAARIPREEWKDETSCNRKGKRGHSVSVSTEAFT